LARIVPAKGVKGGKNTRSSEKGRLLLASNQTPQRRTYDLLEFSKRVFRVRRNT